MNCDFKSIISQFQIDGNFIKAEAYGCGHINDTYAVYLDKAGAVYRVLLQRINSNIFSDVDGLMNNILGVTSYLREKIAARGGDPDRETLTVIKTKDGAPYYKDAEGGCWRVYVFIEDTITLQSARTNDDLISCGSAFGGFLRDLADYKAETLAEVIPDFHNTPKRMEALKKAIAEDKMGRAASVKDEIDFALARNELASKITDALSAGTIPLRVTHNDTKLNNTLVDAETQECICVIDLDTVMPGSALYDYGDAIRFSASTGAEDETDLTKVNFDLGLFEAFTKGYIEASGGSLTNGEMSLMPTAAMIMTFECGIRFLTDYLEGDTYFKIHRPNHNLDRCRTQFKLVADMEMKYNDMESVVEKIKKNSGNER
ncbi:MAG TPA: aminoglycoside phosphotransferase family protein [Firmicutes bacterium]|nr:aminoglycoside phosphotransferase family protein [Bacillota bacterium]